MEVLANISQDEQDRISALPTDLLLRILERLDLRTVIHVGTLSKQWRHLPHQLSRLHLNIAYFQGDRRARLCQIMRAYTGAMWRLLFPPAVCDCNQNRRIKTLRLSFYLVVPQLRSIGRAVDILVGSGKMECLEFVIFPRCSRPSNAQLAEFGDQFMSFSCTYHVTFRWLTSLALKGLAFKESDVPSLINACEKLEQLSLRSCRLVEYSVLKIDAPCSKLQALEFIGFGCTRIELISVPNLRRLNCHSILMENPPVRFGHVPQLFYVSLVSPAIAWQTPFALGECFSMSARYLSILHLNFICKMISIRPQPKQQTAIFRNLTDLYLYNICVQCDLNWTMFILEAVPSLEKFHLSRHSCVNATKDVAEITNLVCQPSKIFVHSNLKLLVMHGLEEETKVVNFVRLVMERAVGLKIIELSDKQTCKECNAVNLESARRVPLDGARSHRLVERLTRGLSSSVEIIIG
ncbi:putative F-box/FBD/LRR-repeat protein At3g49030 [Lolium perenne]|uniref:putative F-box/FBD/LRR-repeat protein At3g49030 n=1 Tax=Lolium perenne TaxID=4522 RepID=UPI003A99845B